MKATRPDLREIENSNCCICNRLQRKDLTEDGICGATQSMIDGQIVRCVGAWAYQKIFRLIKYFSIFTSGMKDRWCGLNYVEICCGPGRCVVKETRKEIDGSSLAIINNPVFGHIKKALFLDANEQVVKSLNTRIKALLAEDKALALLGNYGDEKQIRQHLSVLPTGHLHFVFIDPTECDIPFRTVETIIATLPKADLLINVAVGTDANRNLSNAILKKTHAKVRKKYEDFLGSSDFFVKPETINKAQLGDDEGLRRLFRQEYIRKLEAYGYSYTDLKPVKHYYELLFASKSHVGLDFWKKACKYDHNLQGELPL